MSSASIIVLDGPSSSGKSTLASRLQLMLPQPFLSLDIDLFVNALPQRFDRGRALGSAGIVHRVDGSGRPVLDVGEVGRAFLAGFHAGIAAFVRADNLAIVSHMLLEEAWLRELADAVREFETLYVGVTAPLVVLEQRELARGDRTPGFARSHYHRVHVHGTPDLVVDTSSCSVETCAERIYGRLVEGPSPRAFRTLLDGD
jgi:chloramphenicol 3-O phosphotransferase